MEYLIGGGLLAVVLIVIGIVGRHIEEMGPRISLGLIICGVLSFLVAIILSTFRLVPPGHVGIVTTFGKVHDKVLDEGLNTVLPVSKVTMMSIQIQKHPSENYTDQMGREVELVYTAASKDLQEVNTKMVMNFRLKADVASKVYREIGINYVQTIIEPAAHEILKAQTALYNASEILQKRQQIKMDVQEGIREWLDKYGIELKEISLKDIGFSNEYEAAVEKKQLEEQKAEQKKYELQQAEQDAHIRKAKAKGEADAAREAASGRADAMKIEGEAQAEYNRRVAESLTGILVQSEYIKKWDGQLPRMTTGEGTGILLQMPTNTLMEKTSGKK